MAQQTAAQREVRRELMARRDAALKAKDHAMFQLLTTEIANLDMPGVQPLTARDIANWTRKGKK